MQVIPECRLADWQTVLGQVCRECGNAYAVATRLEQCVLHFVQQVARAFAAFQFSAGREIEQPLAYVFEVHPGFDLIPVAFLFHWYNKYNHDFCASQYDLVTCSPCDSRKGLVSSSFSFFQQFQNPSEMALHRWWPFDVIRTYSKPDTEVFPVSSNLLERSSNVVRIPFEFIRSFNARHRGLGSPVLARNLGWMESGRRVLRRFESRVSCRLK